MNAVHSVVRCHRRGYHRRRLGWWGLALAAACAGAIVAASSAAAQTDRPELVDLRIEGNEVFSDDSLELAIANRQTRCKLPGLLCWIGIDVKDRNYLRPRQIGLDMLRLQYYYRQRGYREATVDTATTPLDDGVRLTFRIAEGRPVRVDTVETVLWGDLPDTAMVRDIPLERGDPLSELLLDEARDSITARLRNDGFAYAEVLVNNFVPRDSYDARVTYEIYPGVRARFGPVQVQGNEELDSISIVRMLPFGEGGRYRARQVQEGQRNLYGLELIQSARIVQQLEEGDTIVPVQVLVAEGQKHRVRTGVGWTTLDCLNAEAQWSSRNFFGGARRLTVRGRVSNILAEEMNATACSQAGSGPFAELNGQLSVELFQPWLISPRNSLSLNAFVERQSVPSVFIRRALGLNVTLSRNLGRRMSLALAWRPTLTQLDAAEIFLCSSFLACIPSDLEIFQNANWLSPLGMRLSQDWRNSILNPTEGYTWFVDLEWADGWTGSDFTYGRAVVEGSFYHEFEELGDRDGVVVATRLRGGVVGQGRFQADDFDDVTLVHPQKRFFSGGANSVRGFSENQLGPRVLTTPVERVLGVPEGGTEPVCTPDQFASALGCDPSALPDGAFTFRPVGGTWVLEANLEVRFPLFSPKLQGVAFVDAGQVWLDREEFQDLDLAWSPGVGVRYMSPIGPIRVDLGYGTRDPERLAVAVRGIRAYDPAIDAPEDRLTVPWVDDGERTLDWVATDNLRFLFPTRTFGDRGSFWGTLWNRLQLHISLGQAF